MTTMMGLFPFVDWYKARRDKARDTMGVYEYQLAQDARDFLYRWLDAEFAIDRMVDDGCPNYFECTQ